MPEPCGDIPRTYWRLGVGHTVKGCAEFAGPSVKGKITFVSIEKYFANYVHE